MGYMCASLIYQWPTSSRGSSQFAYRSTVTNADVDFLFLVSCIVYSGKVTFKWALQVYLDKEKRRDFLKGKQKKSIERTRLVRPLLSRSNSKCTYHPTVLSLEHSFVSLAFYSDVSGIDLEKLTSFLNSSARKTPLTYTGDSAKCCK